MKTKTKTKQQQHRKQQKMLAPDAFREIRFSVLIIPLELDISWIVESLNNHLCYYNGMLESGLFCLTSETLSLMQISKTVTGISNYIVI